MFRYSVSVIAASLSILHSQWISNALNMRLIFLLWWFWHKDQCVTMTSDFVRPSWTINACLMVDQLKGHWYYLRCSHKQILRQSWDQIFTKWNLSRDLNFHKHVWCQPSSYIILICIINQVYHMHSGHQVKILGREHQWFLQGEKTPVKNQTWIHV